MSSSSNLRRPARGAYAFAEESEGGVELVDLIFKLLRVIAAERGGGLRLTEIATRAQLHLPTAHRLLRALEAQRAVIYDPFLRVYYIGHDFLEHPNDTPEARLKRHFRAGPGCLNTPRPEISGLAAV